MFVHSKKEKKTILIYTLSATVDTANQIARECSKDDDQYVTLNHMAQLLWN